MSCGRVLGHGEACVTGHLCDECLVIYDLLNVVGRIQTLAELGEGCPDCHRIALVAEEALSRVREGEGHVRTK